MKTTQNKPLENVTPAPVGSSNLLGPYGCRCRTMRERVTGDGCDICNPTLAEEIKAENENWTKRTATAYAHYQRHCAAKGQMPAPWDALTQSAKNFWITKADASLPNNRDVARGGSQPTNPEKKYE